MVRNVQQFLLLHRGQLQVIQRVAGADAPDAALVGRRQDLPADPGNVRLGRFGGGAGQLFHRNADLPGGQFVLGPALYRVQFHPGLPGESLPQGNLFPAGTVGKIQLPHRPPRPGQKAGRAVGADADGAAFFQQRRGAQMIQTFFPGFRCRLLRLGTPGKAIGMAQADTGAVEEHLPPDAVHHLPDGGQRIGFQHAAVHRQQVHPVPGGGMG